MCPDLVLPVLAMVLNEFVDSVFTVTSRKWHRSRNVEFACDSKWLLDSDCFTRNMVDDEVHFEVGRSK